MKTDADEALATLKANSDEALARLKVGLDAGQTAHRELFGVATIYFYALRSIAYGQWSDETIKMAEDAMISATRHLLYVGDDMRTRLVRFLATGARDTARGSGRGRCDEETRDGWKTYREGTLGSGEAIQTFARYM